MIGHDHGPFILLHLAVARTTTGLPMWLRRQRQRRQHVLLLLFFIFIIVMIGWTTLALSSYLGAAS